MSTHRSRLSCLPLEARHRLLQAFGAAAGAAALGTWPTARAQAQGAAREPLRIGEQKSVSLFVLQKALGSREKRLAPPGVGVKRVEFPAGLPLLEGLNVDSVDIGHVGEASPIFARAAGGPPSVASS